MGLKEKVTQAMKDHPEILPQLFRTLVDSGIAEYSSTADNQGGPAVKKERREPKDDADGVETPKKNISENAGSAAAGSTSSGGASSAGNAGTVQPGSATPDSKDGGHRNYRNMRSMPVKNIEAALTLAEPATFSAANLKSLIPGGKRCMPKESVYELIEFISSYAPDTIMPVEFRSPSGVSTMVAERSSYFGNRGKDLTLPPDWTAPGVGVYVVRRLGCGRLGLLNRFTGNEGIIDETMLQETSKSDDEVYIAENFSEARACLYWKRSGTKIGLCTQVLPLVVEIGVRCPKKPKLQHEALDRASGSASSTPVKVNEKADEIAKKEEKLEAAENADHKVDISELAQPVGLSDLADATELHHDEVEDDEPIVLKEDPYEDRTVKSVRQECKGEVLDVKTNVAISKTVAESDFLPPAA